MSRWMSRGSLAMPSDARTAPTGTTPPRQSRKAARVKSFRSRSSHSIVSREGMRNATSAAPGLQKHPPRTEIPAAPAAASTAS